LVADTYRTILDLGKIFGVSDRAQQRVAQMKRQIAAVRAKVSGKAPVKVLAFYPGKFPLSATGAGITTDLLG
jgi:iron complex transport system substrate-binding protein